MRMRFKPYAHDELMAADFHVHEPLIWGGKWHAQYARPEQPFVLELGCGKGGFISQLACAHPENNYLGIDITDKVLILAKRKIEAAYQAAGRPIDNVKIMSADIERIRNVITLQSKPADLSPLTAAPLPCRLPDYAACAPQHRDAFVPIPQADAAKYQPEDKCYTKILVNGQEPDTRGVRSVNENGRVWGAVLCILERLQTVIPDAFRYDWNAAGGCLTLHSGGHTVTAQVGVTHLLVDGKENLMDGQPYLTAEGALVMEVNALIPHITGTRTQYDDKVNVLRIETE